MTRIVWMWYNSRYELHTRGLQDHVHTPSIAFTLSAHADISAICAKRSLSTSVYRAGVVRGFVLERVTPSC